MKKSIFTLGALTIVAALTAGFTACANEDNLIEEQQQAPSFVYRVSIPANYGGAETRAVEPGEGGKLVSTFKTTDYIYVYNTSNNEKSSVNLTPDADGSSVNLTGNLTFTTPPAIDDVLLLSYTNNASDILDYTNQTGTLAGLSTYDYASATVKITDITGGVITTEPASFINAQSMYKFTFTGLPTGVGVKSVVISSAGENHLCWDFTWKNNKWVNPVTINLDDAARTANGTGVVYAALRFKEIADDATDNITFTVTGTDNNTYIATKTSPVGGFKNSKYYTSTIALQPAYYMATASDIGKVIGSNGKIYSAVSDVWDDGANAIAMIAYIGNVDGVCNHGLAISLTDAYAYNATFADATGDVIIPSWAQFHPVTGGTWRLPSEIDWQYMLWGYYVDNPVAQDISTFNTKLSTVGTALVVDQNYWTSTVIDNDNAKVIYYDYDGTFAGVNSSVKNEYRHVRACLAF